GVGITAAELLRHALNELGNDNRQEELKAFLLGLALGLRRKEADLLEWSSFDFNRGTIQIRPTEFHALKTETSAAILSLDPEIMSFSRGWYALATGPFVRESIIDPRPEARYHHYRANATFDSLITWLRRQGIAGDKPYHTLRKMYGSLIVDR